MIQYLDLLKNVFDNGIMKADRTGVGTKSIFGWQMRFDLSKGFPLLTTKKLHIKSIVHELLWFVKGDTNIQYLNDNDVHIWDDWADDKGNLGPVYGKQWRSWENNGVEIDQLKNAIELIKNELSKFPSMDGLELASKVSTKKSYYYGKLNSKYKVKFNKKTIDRLKNSF